MDNIDALLTTRRIGRPLMYYPQVGSTNDVVHAVAEAGAAEGLVVVADEQTTGRGRLGRSWWAGPGAGLLFSLLLRPVAFPVSRAGQLTMCLGLAAAEGIADATAAQVGLKWPNDVVYEGRKLGGMLAELELAGDTVRYAVLGIGLNVNVDFASAAAPVELRALAVSLAMIVGRPVDRVALLAAVLARFEEHYTRLLAGEPPHTAWAARLDTLGRRVRVTRSADTLTGTATGVTPEGALLLTTDDGKEHGIWSGDVTALRAP